MVVISGLRNVVKCFFILRLFGVGAGGFLREGIFAREGWRRGSVRADVWEWEKLHGPVIGVFF